MREHIDYSHPEAPVYIRRLESFDEGVRMMEKALRRGITNQGESSLEVSDSGWYGTRTMAEAIDQAKYGWQEGTTRFREAVGTIVIDQLVGERQNFHSLYAVAGDEPDIDRYLAGEPENMRTYELRQEPGGKLATFVINNSVSCRVSPERIINRGVAIAAAHAALTAEGYSIGVEIASARQLGDESGYLEYHIPIVHPGGYISEDTLAWSIISPAILRRMMFALDEDNTPEFRAKLGAYSGGGYGTPHDILSSLPPSTLLVDRNEGLDLNSPEAITNFAQNMVNRTTVLLQEAPTSN